MATYSSKTFNSSNYDSNRPRYRDSLADTIIEYHRAQGPNNHTGLAVDVATGTGIFARQLQGKFSRVVGSDISATMLQSAREANSNQIPIEFVESPAEALPFLNSGTVDVMTVATGAHWFDMERFVAEAERVLRPNGTLAIFGYTGFGHFVDYPQCDAIFRDFGIGPTKLGPFWDRGRERLVDNYREYVPILSKNKWQDVQRIVYPGTSMEGDSQRFTVGTKPVVMHFEVTWRTLEDFLSTWSGPVNYHKKYPSRPNITEQVMRELMDAAGVSDRDAKVNIQWEEVLLVGRRPSV
ncbi:S-adenosyl-L-methionine-dependent methyltransferase [Linderina pennispora]|uniref:S-adenosyl-L-methionine-dependent methyltransferase n=1 Tax=Linderina pennispora TaxID=61395 RepID=A0A1Y1WBC6_9FUNG|nr:S-adenosyl-L-methionine-dependent methyltransferase [Linderina pennispora]ORX70454.1 S-adenosyl-L-methionine-dependent methyltransferase [Linderina pennispora]